jgi:phosphohistidine swiveling domain-containing protein
MDLQQYEHRGSEPTSPADIVLPLTAVRRHMLALVGGKGANLGEMIGAGLPVPPGFCLTTRAYTQGAEMAGLDALLAAHMPGEGMDRPEQLAEVARAARACIQGTPMPEQVAVSLVEAYRVLGEGLPLPVAVRSSATAEDLPFASFAGQQETYLNIVGTEALLSAVRDCWASLWTDRAVSYRASLGLDQRRVQLAVVVQRMVEAEVAGVLFTANPLTGKRRQAVIDANPGLGEAVVSGATNPDHFVVTTSTGEVVETRPGDKRVIIRGVDGGGTEKLDAVDRSNEICLSGTQIRTLAALGAQVEALYGTPQDIEWALDRSGHFWLTQTRPVTTLYPLPDSAPCSDDELRVYFSANVVQGVYGPLTPMGIATFRLFGSTVATIFGFPPRHRQQGPGAFTVAASRVFLDVTAVLRHSLGRAFLINVVARFAEVRSADLFRQVVTDPRLSIISRSPWPVVRLAFHLLIKKGFVVYLFQALLRPSAAQARVARIEARLRALEELPVAADAGAHLDAYERLLQSDTVSCLLSILPAIPVGFGAYGLARRLLKDLATPDELQRVIQGLPANPTTEMNLALWALFQQVRNDPDAVQSLRDQIPQQLAQDYRKGTLPPALQQGLTDFLHRYGHRGVAEIDLGLPRWSEDSSHLLGALANYLRLADASLAPDIQFQRSAQEAEATTAELIRRAARKSRWLGMRVRFCLKRARALIGWREKPKFYLILVLARARKLLWTVGEALAQAGRIEVSEDIFFLTPQEARSALAGADMHEVIRERRTSYQHEGKRRHIPRVLLSDGTEPVVENHSVETTSASLRGTPASPGRVTARARVILDPTGAHLEPGEILVAPSTDPGWTPLFLTASGLVMEMGGAISHGAVVAREYGIPAVVGVPGATEQIATGQRILLDGSQGMVTLEV